MKRLWYLLLGAIAGLMVGIIPSVILGVLSNSAYAIGALTICVLIGAIIGIMQRKMIEIFFDGMLELFTLD